MAYRVQKWGNSNGVRIPKVYLEALHIKSGDPINIVRDENKIIITKAEREKASLKQRIKKDVGSDVDAEEFTWDEAKGKEIW